MRYVEYHFALLSISNISNALNPGKDVFSLWRIRLCLVFNL